MAPILAVTLGLLETGASLANVPIAMALHQTGPGGPVAYTLILLAVLLPGTAVGVLLAARRPGNPVGWLLLLVLLLAADPSSVYALLDYRIHHGTLPMGWLAVALLGSAPLVPVCVAILLWLFPDGRLPPGHWRRAAQVIIVGAVLVVMATSVVPGLTDSARHDVHIDVGGNLHPVSPVWMIIGNVTAVAAVASLLAWLVVQVPRYRHSSNERRQQLKWLYSGAAVFICALLGDLIGPSVAGKAFGSEGQIVDDVIELAGSVLVVCIGVAVLKYRLYAIDRIISRVISYAIITAVLAGVFAGLVVLATMVLPVRTPVAIAAATLAAAALFNPLRTRIQHAVDRRFNRARYNAEAIVGAFTEQLRQTVDLDTVRRDLVGAVQDAFEPAYVSVWLAGAQQQTRSPGA